MKLKINVLNHSPPAGPLRFLSVNLCAPVDAVFASSMPSTFGVKCFFFFFIWIIDLLHGGRW